GGGIALGGGLQQLDIAAGGERVGDGGEHTVGRTLAGELVHQVAGCIDIVSVVAETAVHHVVAGAADEEIIPTRAGEDVVATLAAQEVDAGIAGDRVGAVRAGQVEG